VSYRKGDRNSKKNRKSNGESYRCGVKLIDRKKSEELMDMLGIEKTIDRLAKENGLRLYGHVLRREEGSALKKTLHFEVDGTRKRGSPRLIWKNMVNKEMMRFRLTMDDAKKRTKWRQTLNQYHEVNPASSVQRGSNRI